MEKLEWRDIRGYEGIYSISNDGRVMSLARVDAAGRKRKARMLKIRIKEGRPYVALNPEAGKVQAMIHRLVAEAFVENPDPENKKSVIRIDGDKANVRASNLKWATEDELWAHIVNLGLMAHGERHPRNSVSDEMAAKIRRLYKQGRSVSGLAAELNLGRSVVQHIAQQHSRLRDVTVPSPNVSY